MTSIYEYFSPKQNPQIKIKKHPALNTIMYKTIRTNLALAAEPPEQLVVLELALLVGHDPRHFEDEPRPRLLVDAHPVEGQHAHPQAAARVLAHRVHHHLEGRCLLFFSPVTPFITPALDKIAAHCNNSTLARGRYARASARYDGPLETAGVKRPRAAVVGELQFWGAGERPRPRGAGVGRAGLRLLRWRLPGRELFFRCRWVGLVLLGFGG